MKVDEGALYMDLPEPAETWKIGIIGVSILVFHGIEVIRDDSTLHSRHLCNLRIITQKSSDVVVQALIDEVLKWYVNFDIFAGAVTCQYDTHGERPVWSYLSALLMVNCFNGIMALTPKSKVSMLANVGSRSGNLLVNDFGT